MKKSVFQLKYAMPVNPIEFSTKPPESNDLDMQPKKQPIYLVFYWVTTKTTWFNIDDQIPSQHPFREIIGPLH